MSTRLTDDALIARPIIVVGAPRSGTTMLGRILGQHRDLVFLGEPRLTWRYGNDRKSDMLRVQDARPEVRDHIRRRFAQVVRAARRIRLLEKHPSNSLRPAFVDAVFPDCQFVHILRDGINSALSIRDYWNHHAHGLASEGAGARVRKRWSEVGLRRLPYYLPEVLRRLMPCALRPLLGPNVWGPRLPGIERMVREMTTLEIACLQWRMCVETMCGFGRKLPSGRYMECHVESLSSDVIQSILAFCELPDDPAVLAYFQSRHDPSRAAARVQQASPQDLATAQQWTEPTMLWLQQLHKSRSVLTE